MKHPVLKVKKGAIFYDDTEARHSSELTRPPLPGSGPLFSRRKRKRGVPLTFLPLVMVAAGLFIVFRVVPNTPVNRVTIAGWQATLRVTPYQDKLIVGVTFLSSAPSPANPHDAKEATVGFSLPGTGEQALVTGALEKSPMTLRADLSRWPARRKYRRRYELEPRKQRSGCLCPDTSPESVPLRRPKEKAELPPPFPAEPVSCACA